MKRETTVAFLAGTIVAGAFFAGLGMGSASGSAATQKMEIVNSAGSNVFGAGTLFGGSNMGMPITVRNASDFARR
ncbi:MAG: hypothetical protein GY885_12610 [Phycisphaeraceae bacterium]|nr:hypothetical protein [Phycisphaeraceae bacterium]MCP4495712.1 hypothetical protein [Phycisphaeraceae bacterium]MCP4796987.1 hypothetical protein [Phycisphaeraceae bacterium]|tara:strand:+ start:64 stop:288 length:225 start_codon:yes stop_codon:yes gene_type:complete